MSETKHTPGPWKAIAQGGSSTVVASTLPSRNDKRSEVTYGYREGGEYCLGYPFLYQTEPYTNSESTRMDFVCFSHADALLIAAAPDMLEALNECAEYFDRFADAEFTQDGPNPNREMTLLQSVTRALDKAEGR